MFKKRITEMFITYGNILLVFKHHIFQSKPCFKNTKSLFYYIVEIHSSYKNKSYSLESYCTGFFCLSMEVWQSSIIQSNQLLLKSSKQPTRVKEAAGKCLKTESAKKDASEDQYCYFFHPSTSKFVISLNWANVGLQGSNKQYLQRGFLLI